MTIEDNIAARKVAEEILQMVEGEKLRDRIVQHLLGDWIADVQETDKKLRMTDAEAKAWESATTMSFGKHAGTRIKDVPHDYLIYLSSNEFQRELQRYTASDYFIKTQPEPEEWRQAVTD